MTIDDVLALGAINFALFFLIEPHLERLWKALAK